MPGFFSAVQNFVSDITVLDSHKIETNSLSSFLKYVCIQLPFTGGETTLTRLFFQMWTFTYSLLLWASTYIVLLSEVYTKNVRCLEMILVLYNYVAACATENKYLSFNTLVLHCLSEFEQHIFRHIFFLRFRSVKYMHLFSFFLLFSYFFQGTYSYR